MEEKKKRLSHAFLHRLDMGSDIARKTPSMMVYSVADSNDDIIHVNMAVDIIHNEQQKSENPIKKGKRDFS